MNDDWYLYPTNIVERETSRPSVVLKSDGQPFYLEKRKEPIGFLLKPTK